MNFFDKRPLSLILCISLGSFVFSSFSTALSKIILTVCALTVILAAIFLKTLSSHRAKIILCSFVIILASLLSYLYFDLWFYADKRYEDRCEIEGVVESVNFDNSVKTIVLKADSVNGDPFSSYKLLVTLDDEEITNVSASSAISFSAKLNPFSSTLEFDEASYYYARGYNAQADEVEALTICGVEDPSFTHKISEYRRALSRKLVINSNEENGGLLAALLLGEKEFLNGQTRLDFSRIGITHILALSGMHLAMLCFGLSRILSMLGVGKKLRKIFEVLFAIGYIALTGFPVSVVRAGIMLILASILFLLSASKDSATNLFLAVSLILLIEPYSVFDISLWLSAFATLGIIICVEIFEKDGHLKIGLFKNAVLSISTSFISSVFAIVSTIALTHFKFGKISSLSLISTVLFSPLILLFMFIGVFLIFTSSFIPLGSLINFFGDFIRNFAHTLSKFKYAELSSNFSLTEILVIISSIIFLLFIVLKVNKKKTVALVIVCSLIFSIFSAGIYTAAQTEKFVFSYDETDENERILMKSDSQTSLIEISEINTKLTRGTLVYLENRDIMYLDNYIITSYNYSSLHAIESLLSNVYVENLHIPAPKSELQKQIYSQLLNLRKTFDIKLHIYTEGYMIHFSDFTFFPVYYDKNNRFAFTILYNDEFYTYVTANMLDDTAVNHALKIMNGANTVIVGAKGKTGAKFTYKLNGDTKIIYNKKTGLSNEILKYYENRITVDPNGSLDLYVE